MPSPPERGLGALFDSQVSPRGGPGAMPSLPGGEALAPCLLARSSRGEALVPNRVSPRGNSGAQPGLPEGRPWRHV